MSPATATAFSRSLIAKGALMLSLTSAVVLSSSASADDNPPARSLDWHPKEQLTPEQQQRIPLGCCGAYVDPLATSPLPQTSDSEETNITITGRHSQITKTSTLVTGEVELVQGGRKLTGDKAELFNDPQSVEVQGTVTYRERGFLLEGDRASVNLEQDALAIDKARYVLHPAHVHGNAEHIRRNEKGVISLIQSTYTRCEPLDTLWKLRSSSMTLDIEQGQGVAKHVRLEVEEIPVFYLPYLRFPINDQRQSGFLAPSFTRGEDGLDISLPYYLNLAPHYDMTLVPRVIEDRGTQLGAEFRHLSQHFSSVATASLLPDDRQYEDDRWLVGFHQQGGALKPWSTAIDFARVSDVDYFEDLGSSSLSVSQTTHLKQAAQAGYMTNHWDTQIEVESFQTLRDSSTLDDPYSKWPSLSVNGFYALGHGLSAELNHALARFEHSDENQITGERAGTDYTLRWRHEDQAFFVEPALSLYYREQQLTNMMVDENPAIAIPGATLSAGMIFEQVGTTHLHTFEPKIFYAYTDYENQDDFQLFDTDEIEFNYAQLYDRERLAGGDRIVDNHQTAIGWVSRWLNPVDHREWMRFGMGQVNYHADRRITGFDTSTFSLLPADYRDQYTRARSPLATQWQWFFHPDWQLDSELIWDDNSGETRQGKVFLHYADLKKYLFSIGYRHTELLTELSSSTYVLETVQQGHLSTYIPLNNQWALMSGLQYDFTHQRALEAMVGFQYEDCCWRLRTLMRRWETNPEDTWDTALHESNRGIFLEIQFKGLASTGNKINTLLEDNIFGYTSQD